MIQRAAAALEMRALTLKCFCEVAQSLDIDGFDILRRENIHVKDIQNPERRLPALRILKALETAATESGCDSFAILMAEHRSFEDLGAMSLLMQHLETPRDVIEASARYKSHYNDLLQISIEEVDGQALVTWDLHPADNARQAIDLGVALAYLLLTGSSGSNWRARSIHLTHPAPKDLRPWRRMFDCPLEFGSTFNGLCCSLRALSEKNPRANRVLAKHAAVLLDLLPASAVPVDLEERVRRRIVTLLPEGRATLVEVASTLDISPRKLQRQLQDTGISFSTLLDSVRLQKAKRELKISQNSVSTIADMLGYTSSAAFSRWFISKTGQQPSVWRASTENG